MDLHKGKPQLLSRAIVPTAPARRRASWVRSLLNTTFVARLWWDVRRFICGQNGEGRQDVTEAPGNIAAEIDTRGVEQVTPVTSSCAWQIYERVSPQERLRQGDLIEFGDSDPLRSVGLVVTADCDLEQRKHGQLITLVPVVTVRTVVEHYLLLEELDRQRENIWSYVRKQFGISGDINDPIVAAQLRSMILEAEAKGDQQILCLAANARLNRLDSISAGDFGRVMRAASSLSVDKTLQRIESQIKTKGDLVLLPRPDFLKESVEVVWVRQVWQVPIRNIVLKNSEAMEGMGFRVARLESPFRYRVTQVMGQVFSDIGMPPVANNVSEILKGIFSE